MPPLSHPAIPVAEVLQDAGPSVGGGMAPAALGYADLVAWEHMHGVTLTRWAAMQVRRLSRVYCGQLQEATDPNAPAPWQPLNVDRETVSDGFSALLDAFGSSKKAAKANNVKVSR